MHARFIGFGAVEIEGERWEKDVVIDGGRLRKRDKKPSKPHKAEYGHTPLSVSEAIPWGGRRLIVGTGAYGRLPILPEVAEEARQRGIDLIAVPTEEACRLVAESDADDVHAILHVTC
jgi:hypothetical protein